MAAAEADKWEALGQLPPLQRESTGVTAVLEAQDVFPAFGGVLCLVFKGFPRPVERLKEELDACGPAALGGAWVQENMGSKWAKVTLAAVRDEVPPASIDAEAVAPKLRDICESFRSELRQIRIPIHTLSAVRFTTRDLATRLDVRKVPLPEGAGGASELSDKTTAITSEVLDDFFVPERTVPYCATHLVQRRTSASRYLETVDPPMHTLVAYLADSPDQEAVAALHAVLAKFRAAVAELLGADTVQWFDPEFL
eukprot:CAMPEP_0174842040 /NCGR_PEP_ID=MMETSP1114-20130205/9673_1 /TAXON_ID=312471 /ORGANISM="Neobodo designis, Strain CCAP 1951/1" /LENGTH=253 /DNA_ID=CAMNT_0016076237 /DNA_START=43 /DNA_END=801 /DNA_ORIENTATION=+